MDQLERLTTKSDQLSSNNNDNRNDNYTTPMLNGKRLNFKKHDAEGYYHSCGCKYLIGHSRKTRQNPKPGHTGIFFRPIRHSLVTRQYD